MDAENPEKARAIPTTWGLTEREIEQVLEPPDAAKVISIHEALNAIYEGRQDRASAWLKRQNTDEPFLGQRPLDFMLSGDLERVRRYLQYYVYNA